MAELARDFRANSCSKPEVELPGCVSLGSGKDFSVVTPIKSLVPCPLFTFNNNWA